MNVTVITGRLGKDAEVKKLDSGKTVINYSVAVDNGKDQPPIWFDCSQWSEKTAVAQYLTKGTQVCVQGKVDIRKWEGGATLTLRVDKVDLIGGRKDAGTDAAPVDTSEPLPF